MPDKEVPRKEVENGFNQFERLEQLIDEGLAARQRGEKFMLGLAVFIEMNRLAVDGLIEGAGSFRDGPIKIKGSNHVPPPDNQVPALMEAMCAYVNENWTKSAVHLASYVMWRTNWIHPFRQGNGRATRAVSYLVLCMRLGMKLPGRKTIPERIAEDKGPYYKALERADEAWEEGERTNLQAMEKLVSDALHVQLDDAATTSAERDTSPSMQRESIPVETPSPTLWRSGTFWTALTAVGTLILAGIGAYSCYAKDTVSSHEPDVSDEQATSVP